MTPGAAEQRSIDAKWKSLQSVDFPKVHLRRQRGTLRAESAAPEGQCRRASGSAQNWAHLTPISRLSFEPRGSAQLCADFWHGLVGAALLWFARRPLLTLAIAIAMVERSNIGHRPSGAGRQ